LFDTPDLNQHRVD